jgi:DNA-directed RNA polymerase specialized sigma24 family protein
MTWASDAEFRACSRRLRLLADRALRNDDHEATLELLELLEPVARRMVGRLDVDDREPALYKLLHKALAALKKGLHNRQDEPLAYVIVVMRNEVRTEFRKLLKHRERETELPDAYDPGDPSAHHLSDEFHVRQLLEQFVAEARATGRPNEIKVAEVLVVQYLFGVTPAEACDILVYSAAEKRTITEKIDKQRTQPGSRLCRLAEQVMGVPVRPNTKRPRRTPGQCTPNEGDQS